MPFKITKLGEQPVEQQYDSSNENIGQTIGRNIARLPVTAAKTIGSIPGEAEATVRNLTKSQHGQIAQALGIPQELHAQLETPGLLSHDHVFPTYEELGKGIKEKAPYLAPQGPIEEQVDSAVSRVIDLMTGGVKAGRAIGATAAGKLGKYYTQSYTGSEEAGDAVDVGTTLLTLTGGRKPLEAKNNALFDEARSFLPEEAKFKAPVLRGQIEHEIKKLKRSDMTSKSFVEDRLKELKKIVGPAGTVDINELWSRKKELNDHFKTRDLPVGAEKELIKMIDWLNDVLKREYGTTNPRFSKALDEADKFHRGLREGSKLKKFFEKNINFENIAHPVVLGALGFKAVTPIQAAKAGAGLLAGKEIVYLTEALARSKEVRKEWFSLLRSGAKGSAIAANRYAKKLSDSMQQEFPIEQPAVEEARGRFRITRMGS
ncbi:MAG: hypothetical protein ACHQVS_00570 [Candidatus Babeliales bacterium]